MVIPSAVHSETAEETMQRRMRESIRYEERVKVVKSPADLQEKLKAAGSNLVVVEVSSPRWLLRGGHS